MANNVGNLELEPVSNQLEISSAGVGGVGFDDNLTYSSRMRTGEIYNGRLAMIGIVLTGLLEYFSGQPLIHFFGISN